MIGRLALCLFVVAALLASSPAFALKISPFKVSMVPSEDGGTYVFRIENNADEPAAIQVGVLTWEIAEDGREINADAEDDFVVFPAQMVLKPRESRAVRVQWLGERDISTEKAYRFLAEQVPVNLRDTPEAGTAVRFLLKFKAALYVTPPGAQSDVRVEQVDVRGDVLRVTLANKGTRHTLLNNPRIMLRLQDGREILLEKDVLVPLAGQNMHAGARRFFDLARPAQVTGDIAEARFSAEGGF